jgi:hypothetical protein
MYRKRNIYNSMKEWIVVDGKDVAQNAKIEKMCQKNIPN